MTGTVRRGQRQRDGAPPRQDRARTLGFKRVNRGHPDSSSGGLGLDAMPLSHLLCFYGFIQRAAFANGAYSDEADAGSGQQAMSALAPPGAKVPLSEGGARAGLCDLRCNVPSPVAPALPADNS